MAVEWDDLEPRKPAKLPALGADLSQLSVGDLGNYLEALHAEIERVSAKVKEKQLSRDAAHSVFKT
jgi:uncharacterized small protein (DUF1192 family)